MSDHESQDKTSPNIRNGAMSTAGLGTLMMGLTHFLKGDSQQIAALCVPIASSILAGIGMYCYCRWIEPHGLVSIRAGLKRDLKEQKSIIDDSYTDEETKNQAKKIYSATKMRLATLRQDYASGLYRIVPQSDQNTTT